MQVTKRRPRATTAIAFSVPPHQTYKPTFSGTQTCRTQYDRVTNLLLNETRNTILKTLFVSPRGHLTSSLQSPFGGNIFTSNNQQKSRQRFSSESRCEKAKHVFQSKGYVATKQTEKHTELTLSSASSSKSSPTPVFESSGRSFHQKRSVSTVSNKSSEKLGGKGLPVGNSSERRANGADIEESTVKTARQLKSNTKSSSATVSGNFGQKQATQTNKREDTKEPNDISLTKRFPMKTDSKSIVAFIAGTERQKSIFIHELRNGKRTLSIDQFNELVSCLSRRGSISNALAVVEIAEHGVMADKVANAHSAKSYTIMIDVYGKAQQLSKAFALFHKMGQMGATPTVVTYNAMIASCARCSEPDLAYEVFEEMQMNGFKPDKFSYGALIDSCAKCGKVDRAFEISDLMETNGVEKDETIYSALMDACGRTEQLERALAVFEGMKRKGVWPNQVTFSVLIDTCARVKQPERAFYLYSEMKHWGYTTANVVVFTALIDACAKCGWPDRAELVVQAMISQGIEPNQITFGALMEGWAREGRLDRAFEVLDRMAIKHNVLPNAVLIGGLIASCRRLGETWRVRKLWKIIVSHNLRPSKIYYPVLILMALTEKDLKLATAVVLHAYARGCLRRAALNSEDPAMHAMACAIIYYRHEIFKSEYGKSNNAIKTTAYSLNTVFKSLAMSKHDMDKMSASAAREVCLTWGNNYMRGAHLTSRPRGGTRRDKNSANRKENMINTRRHYSEMANSGTRRNRPSD